MAIAKRVEAERAMAADDLVAERVYGLVKAQLMAGGFGLDERLDIARLAQRFSASTTPVREALTRLAAERMIVAEAKHGFYARLWSEVELRALYQWRGLLLEQAVLAAPSAVGDDDGVAGAYGAGATGAGPNEKNRRSANPTGTNGAGANGNNRPALSNAYARRVALVCAAAEAGANGELRIAGANADERLHRARAAEPDLMPAETQRAALATGLRAPGARARVRAVRVYHATRMAQAAAIRERAILAAVARKGGS